MTLRHWAVAGLVLAMAGCGSRPTTPQLDEAVLLKRLQAFAEDKQLTCKIDWTGSTIPADKWMVACLKGWDFQNEIIGFGSTKAEAIDSLLNSPWKDPQVTIETIGGSDAK